MFGNHFPDFSDDTFSDYLFLALPSLSDEDGIFDHSCVAILDKPDASTHTGIVLNKPTDMELNELFKDAIGTVLENVIVHCGGPVDQKGLYFCKITLEDSGFLSIKTHIKFEDALEIAIQSPSNIRILPFIGHAIWEAGQLSNEVKQSYWVPSIHKEKAFRSDWDHQLWKTLMAEVSPYHELLSEIPLEIHLN